MEGEEKLTTANAKKEEGNAFFKQGRCNRQQSNGQLMGLSLLPDVQHGGAGSPSCLVTAVVVAGYDCWGAKGCLFIIAIAA